MGARSNVTSTYVWREAMKICACRTVEQACDALICCINTKHKSHRELRCIDVLFVNAKNEFVAIKARVVVTSHLQRACVFS